MDDANERPMLKAPHWGANVITYLFFGGIMGGLSLLALVADPTREDERRMRRTARFTSLALAAINPLLLISHLGRPERFLMMLRIAKIKSPMSLGVWGLVLFSSTAGINALRELTKRPNPGVAQALLGGFVASYTGVLLSATAVPLWGAGKRHIPALCVGSGLAGACALSSLFATLRGDARIAERLERMEMLTGVAELAILLDFRRTAGAYGRPMFEGARGARLRRYTLHAGILAPLALNAIGACLRLPKPLNTWRTLAASTLSLIGGYILRETLIEAGKDSARDPRAALHQPR